MDHRVEHGSHHREDGLKVSRIISWPSLLSTIDFVALFLMLPIFPTCESTPQDFQRTVPSAPTLSWSPSHRILVKGERIELKCSPPEGEKGENYFFNRMNEKGEWKKYVEQNRNTLLISALRMAPKAKFSCSYTGRSREGKRAQSPRSNWAEFSVIEPPPTPRLSPDPPQPLYLVGEKIVLWCSIPNITFQGWRRYEFSHIRQNEDKTSIKDLEGHEGNNSLVLTATREDSGVYKCRYLEWKHPRHIPSEWSRPVSIVVRDPLPPPVLKLHPSSGSPGEGKSILCVSSESNNTKTFHFSKDGVEMTSSREEPVKSNRNSGLLNLNMSVAFLNAEDNGSLRFACRYEENITGRWVISPWSQMLNITAVTDPFVPPVAYATLVLLVPFLGATLVFCWCRSKTALGCQRRSDPKEGKEETRSNDLRSENLVMEDLQDSELTYASVMNSSPLIPLEPRTKNGPNTREEYKVIYSDVQVHTTRRAAP